MHKPNLLGLTGKMGAGKSTAVEIIKELYDQPVATIKLAAPLYDIQEMIYDRIKGVYKRPDNFIKDRKLLQLIGTDWGRDTLSKTLWVDLWRHDALTHTVDFPNDLIIVDDVRFDEEAKAIKELGGTIVLLTSTRNAGTIDNGTGIKGHASEAGISKCFIDAVIENNGTKTDFRELLTELQKRLGIW